jgi:hypothetical protein
MMDEAREVVTWWLELNLILKRKGRKGAPNGNAIRCADAMHQLIRVFFESSPRTYFTACGWDSNFG